MKDLNPKEEKIISDAEDAAYGADTSPETPDQIAEREAAEEAQADEEAMPAGHDQIDSDMTPEQIRKVRLNMYFFHAIVGPLLLPVALLLRVGRWSMRTLWAHHNGHEFGGF